MSYTINQDIQKLDKDIKDDGYSFTNVPLSMRNKYKYLPDTDKSVLSESNKQDLMFKSDGQLYKLEKVGEMSTNSFFDSIIKPYIKSLRNDMYTQIQNMEIYKSDMEIFKKTVSNDLSFYKQKNKQLQEELLSNTKEIYQLKKSIEDKNNEISDLRTKYKDIINKVEVIIEGYNTLSQNSKQMQNQLESLLKNKSDEREVDQKLDNLENTFNEKILLTKSYCDSLISKNDFENKFKKLCKEVDTCTAKLNYHDKMKDDNEQRFGEINLKLNEINLMKDLYDDNFNRICESIKNMSDDHQKYQNFVEQQLSEIDDNFKESDVIFQEMEDTFDNFKSEINNRFINLKIFPYPDSN